MANQRTGIDVDKFDYLKRDSQAVRRPISFDHTRFKNFIRIIEFQGKKVMCYRDMVWFELITKMFICKWLLRVFLGVPKPSSFVLVSSRAAQARVSTQSRQSHWAHVRQFLKQSDLSSLYVLLYHIHLIIGCVTPLNLPTNTFKFLTLLGESTNCFPC